LKNGYLRAVKIIEEGDANGSDVGENYLIE
jgi:hypothetical protein